jgi:thiol-disulfide isomerase/thioredoxin
MRVSVVQSSKLSSFPIGFSINKTPVTFLLRYTHPKLHSRLAHAHTHPPNQVLSPITTPPIFHDHLRLASSNNTLLLLLFTTSSCMPCRSISPLLESLVTSRTPQPVDRFSSLAFAEVELDSSDHSNGAVADLGMEYGISSIPSLVGFGGRRAERVTERVVDTQMMGDRERMKAWLDEWMEKGDPFGTDSGTASSRTGGLLGKFFGGN